MAQKFMYILDAGHGGIIDGEYQTSGKRSPQWEDGSQYFEGEGNRDIRKRLSRMMDEHGLAYHWCNAGQEDVDLDDRVAITNSICRAYGTKNCILISIHSNGFKKPEAEGWEIFTTRGTTESDKVATIIFEEAERAFPRRKFRKDTKDGDPDKEANFYIIAHSNCKAVLTENFFHTNPKECKEILLTEEGREKIARFHFNAIMRMEQEL